MMRRGRRAQFWLLATETDLRRLRAGIVPEAVKQSARLLLRPLTRTDNGIATPIYKRGRGR